MLQLRESRDRIWVINTSASKCLRFQLLQLSWFTVQPWKQQPGGLSDIIAVQQQTLAMLGVNYGHPHPFHQRRQQQERPGKQETTLKMGVC